MTTPKRTLAVVMKEIAVASVDQRFSDLVALGQEAAAIKGVLDTLTATVYEELAEIVALHRDEIEAAGGDGVVLTVPFAEGAVTTCKLQMPSKATVAKASTRGGGSGTAPTGRVDISNDDLLALYGDRPYEGATGAHGQAIDLEGKTNREAFDLGAGDDVKDKHNARANVRKALLRIHTRPAA